ncbi:glutathione-disulfide reductase [Denitrificimonas sp. JX-1]|uniref:Glutathione-disulfide reductase n=1 Tax=Denitrificimonas halotolerans TaxID=3098930 RepID=A0ABU5GPN5_9GAMM|nr:glutathione-disulfide reductase [Denitrificimonas sp. JX-1]MDY7218958.1 glutathione-disulfide reductase [Denitrificimonas sp. JX-1]
MSYDFDLFVIGAGSGGVRASRFAASYGARVAVAESRYLGGTCVNVGCVPKKLMVYAAHYQDEFALSRSFGWSVEQKGFNWNTLISNKNTEIERLNEIYKKLLINSGVTLINGHAKIVDTHTVEVEGKQYTAEHILIAVGGWPQIPDIPGREYATDSNQVFFLKEQPKRVLIIGGGYIAVEFASVFHGLGSETQLAYRGDLFLRGFDTDVREHVHQELLKKGMTLRFNCDVQRIDKQDDNSLLITFKDGQTSEVDCVFYATGRRPMLDNLGLENVKVKLDNRGYIEVDDQYQTSERSVLAIGDVTGGIQLTPVALAEGMAVARRLFRKEEYKPVNYDLIPTAVFCIPNISTVGLSEEDAKAEGYDVDVYKSSFRPMKLSLSDQQERIFMKLVVDKATDRVLGCHMVGPDAGELIQGLAVALKAGATKQVFDETIGIHPSAAEEFVTMRTPSTD